MTLFRFPFRAASVRIDPISSLRRLTGVLVAATLLSACGGETGGDRPGGAPGPSVSPPSGTMSSTSSSVAGPGTPPSPTPAATPSGPTPSPASRPTSIGGSGTENLFVSLLGKSQGEVDAKLEEAVNRFFGIGTNEPSTPTADSGYRCYYELPQDSSMAFIWAADSNDVRSEGMSYGMMIAVQMDMPEQFDKLWKFARTHMQFSANSPINSWRHYFRWQGSVNTSNSGNWSVNFGDTTTPAPDGDEYFAAALYLADLRWGSSGAVNYKQEADAISGALLHNPASADGRGPIINPGVRQVVFVPYGDSNNFTDPSYHLPAFYELFALHGPGSDADTWRDLAEVSRDFLVKSAHPSTGLHPDYASFDGQPRSGNPGDGHERFQYDAWRVVLNMAIDYAWFSGDQRMQGQVEKMHAFFASRLNNGNVANSLFNVDGSNASGGGSTALTATLGAGALASDDPSRETFINNVWNIWQQEGKYRYYQECVYLLGLLATGGRFNYSW